ncbi:enhancer of split M2 protein [Drosophila teissieri]|uniref:enhancer of split M2 protein n=1 Tax=Drosophila teissieri TaxID=7243 RepID=UPI001CBA3A86|nr:enhancer of split M2 protein [Drosophila teissieri]
MYLDTKNLTASSTSALTAATASNTKSTRRMRNVWKPLSRLLKVGGKGRTTPLTLAHPNNVDLNNTQQQQQQQQELLIEDDTKSTPEESIHKYGLELRQLPEELEQESLTQPPNTPTLISSVHVDKVSAQSCGNCQHGRNCQHRHHSSNINSSSSSSSSSSNNMNSSSSNMNSSSSATQLPSNLWDLQLPLQYISTDNGTFFWANTQDRVDDDLLHALLCQSFSQLPGTLC